MTEIAIIGCGHVGRRALIIEALHSLYHEKNLDVVMMPDFAKNESVAMEVEPDVSVIRKIVSGFDSECVIKVPTDVQNYIRRGELHQENKRIEYFAIKRKFPIPAQCKRAAKIQTTWMRRK